MNIGVGVKQQIDFKKIYRSFDFFACGERKDDDHFMVINFRGFDARSIRSILINTTGFHVNSKVKPLAILRLGLSFGQVRMTLYDLYLLGIRVRIKVRARV